MEKAITYKQSDGSQQKHLIGLTIYLLIPPQLKEKLEKAEQLCNMASLDIVFEKVYR